MVLINKIIESSKEENSDNAKTISCFLKYLILFKKKSNLLTLK